MAPFEVPEIIRPYIEKLIPVAYDKRIPIMVAGYFHDMKAVIERLSHAMKDSGYFSLLVSIFPRTKYSSKFANHMDFNYMTTSF